MVAMVSSAFLVAPPEGRQFDRLWVLFGGANQLMASLALMLVTAWLMSFSATMRPSLAARAVYTTPIPPPPMRASI